MLWMLSGNHRDIHCKALQPFHDVIIRQCFCVDFTASSSPRRLGSRLPISTKAPDLNFSTKLGGIGGIAAPVGL